MANRLLQYLAARGIADRFSTTQLSGYDIPEWELAGPSSSAGHRRWPKLDVQRVDAPWLFSQIESGALDRLKINAVVSDLTLMPDRHRAAEILDCGKASYHATTEDEIVIHVRLEDIMTPGRHTSYGPLPLAWYDEIISDTGLRPVFVGQFSTDAYSQALKIRFPDATILEAGSVLHDFQTIRHAHNVALGISTFSWLAAWLGAKERIFYPMLGLLNPNQNPQINLMPVDDPRYVFHQFPVRNWMASSEEIDALIMGPSTSEQIAGAQLKKVLVRAEQATATETQSWKERVAASSDNLDIARAA